MRPDFLNISSKYETNIQKKVDLLEVVMKDSDELMKMKQLY